MLRERTLVWCMCTFRVGIITCEEPGTVEFIDLIDIPSSPVSIKEWRSTTLTQESGSNPSVLGVKRGLTISTRSTRTSSQKVGWMVHDGELKNRTPDIVILRLQATSNVRGPVPHMDAFCKPAAYHNDPPPSMVLPARAPAPIIATFVRFVPHKMAVGP